jgi:hypothetical protein
VRDVVPGPVLFARYAFPPNSHGYCGPNDHTAFFEYGVAGEQPGWTTRWTGASSRPTGWVARGWTR